MRTMDAATQGSIHTRAARLFGLAVEAYEDVDDLALVAAANASRILVAPTLIPVANAACLVIAPDAPAHRALRDHLTLAVPADRPFVFVATREEVAALLAADCGNPACPVAALIAASRPRDVMLGAAMHAQRHAALALTLDGRTVIAPGPGGFLPVTAPVGAA
ncbi:MAG TPA: hypothetical protein VHH11_14010 [Gammaproteobacteria bacterium]|nr:hypothetical protein [Gammaproteobacteria bacterium]